MSPTKKKRAYIVQEKDADYCLAVVAYTGKEAKRMAFGHECLEDAEWINIETKWKKNIDVSHLDIGIIEDGLVALKLGLYGYIEYEDCPNCENEDTVVYYDERYYCENCEDVGDKQN